MRPHPLGRLPLQCQWRSRDERCTGYQRRAGDQRLGGQRLRRRRRRQCSTARRRGIPMDHRQRRWLRQIIANLLPRRQQRKQRRRVRRLPQLLRHGRHPWHSFVGHGLGFPQLLRLLIHHGLVVLGILVEDADVDLPTHLGATTMRQLLAIPREAHLSVVIQRIPQVLDVGQHQVVQPEPLDVEEPAEAPEGVGSARRAADVAPHARVALECAAFGHGEEQDD
mmetsp:Transcript_101150/g.324960  ORF Transcript_101150/g.324960 Transcript_101150/m.324960 type:complete len:223 (-) Transcript_101150:284-952(-)